MSPRLLLLALAAAGLLATGCGSPAMIPRVAATPISDAAANPGDTVVSQQKCVGTTCFHYHEAPTAQR